MFDKDVSLNVFRLVAIYIVYRLTSNLYVYMQGMPGIERGRSWRAPTDVTGVRGAAFDRKARAQLHQHCVRDTHNSPNRWRTCELVEFSEIGAGGSIGRSVFRCSGIKCRGGPKPVRCHPCTRAEHMGAMMVTYCRPNTTHTIYTCDSRMVVVSSC